MKRSFQYGDQSFEFSVIENTQLNNKIRIHVFPNTEIEVEAPLPHQESEIRNAVQKRARWISQRVAEFEQSRAFVLPREYVSGETHFFLGRRYKLKVIEDPVTQSSVKLNRGEICVACRVSDPVAVRRRLEDWYLAEARNYFPRTLKGISEKITWVDRCPEIKFVKMDTQWGSLSPDNIMHVNPALIKAPIDCIEYVLIHELCHLLERNHGKNYYRLLRQQLPEWKRLKSKLDGLAELVLAR